MPQEATGKTGAPSDARQKPERPRDELGRPLPWGEASRLHLPFPVTAGKRFVLETLVDRTFPSPDSPGHEGGLNVRWEFVE